MDKNKDTNIQLIIIDAKDLIAGRLASIVAKLLLDGHRVIVVNAESILISGNKKSILKDWFNKLRIFSITNPKHGPFHPRTPNGIFTRMVRGMIPKRKAKGVVAFKKLRVYTRIPKEYLSVQKTTFDEAKPKKPLSYYISLQEISLKIGWSIGKK